MVERLIQTCGLPSNMKCFNRVTFRPNTRWTHFQILRITTNEFANINESMSSRNACALVSNVKLGRTLDKLHCLTTPYVKARKYGVRCNYIWFTIGSPNRKWRYNLDRIYKYKQGMVDVIQILLYQNSCTAPKKQHTL